MLLGTTKEENSKVVVGISEILFKPIMITAFDIFPSQYRPGKEAIRLTAWTDMDGEFKEISVVTESVGIIETLKNAEPGVTYETMIVKDSKTKRYRFSKVTKEQQKELQDKFNEKRQQHRK